MTVPMTREMFDAILGSEALGQSSAGTEGWGVSEGFRPYCFCAVTYRVVRLSGGGFCLA